MGTAQLAFEGEYWGATGSHKTGSVLCACTTGSWSISALLGPFYLLVGSDVPGSDVTGSGRNWMYVLRMRGFFPRYFLLTRVPWLPNVTKGHLTRSGFPWVCACVIGSYTISAPDRKWRLFFLLFSFFSVFFCFFFQFIFISMLLFLIYFFIQHVQQVITQHSVQRSSLPLDFLRAWWRLSCYVLHIDMWWWCCRRRCYCWCCCWVCERKMLLLLLGEREQIGGIVTWGRN